MDNNKIKKYSLQLLKDEVLQLAIGSDDIYDSKEINLKNIRGLFGEDNTFCFARQKSRPEFHPWNTILFLWLLGAPIVSKDYYLVDYFTDSNISGLYPECFTDNDMFEHNGIKYFSVALHKFLPAKLLEQFTVTDMVKVQDAINRVLTDEPGLITELFESTLKFDKDEYDEDKAVKKYSLNYDNNRK